MERSTKNSGKIVMIGCLEMGLGILRYLLDNKIKISYIVTITKEKALSQKVSGYQSYSGIAIEYDIPIYYAEKYSLKSQKDKDFFKKEGFDLMIQGGWQRLFPQEILKTMRIGAIGIHGSSEFLPRGRGRSPINWSIIQGRKRFIFHYFLIKEGVDDGDIFHYEIVDINEWDTCRTIYYKNSLLTRAVYFEWIPKLFSGDFKLYPQIGEPTYYLKRTAEDGIIDWTKSVIEIYNLIRAIGHPYPGAYSFINGVKILIWSAQPFDTKIGHINKNIGEILGRFETGDFIVNCGDGLLLVTEYDSETDIGICKEGEIFQSC